MSDWLLEAFGCVAVLAAALGAAWLTNEVRAGHLSARATRLGAYTCGLGLVAMIVSDFPLAANRFWADHSVLAAMLSSALLVGAIYLAYEHRELERQEELAAGLSGTAFAGLVDYMVDLELALSLATMPVPPDLVAPDHWADWQAEGKPLRWLRSGRSILGTPHDPRLHPAEDPDHLGLWAGPLIDQSIRRLFAGIRDWGPLARASTDGTTVLLLLSDIRVTLMDLATSLDSGGLITAESKAVLNDVRRRARVLAVLFEQWSGARSLRPEILTTPSPLGPNAPSFERFSKTLDDRLTLAVTTVGMEKT